jgi:hypothetical protein
VNISWKRSQLFQDSNIMSALQPKSTWTPHVSLITYVIGLLALPGISRSEYEWEGGGGGGRRRRWSAVIAGRRTGRRRYSTRGYCSARGGVEGLRLALEASNLIDCQLIQSFPVPEYISPITKISNESNPSTKRKPTSHDYGNGGGNRWWAWGAPPPLAATGPGVAGP